MAVCEQPWRSFEYSVSYAQGHGNMASHGALAYPDRMDIHSRSKPCAGGIARRIELRDGVFGPVVIQHSIESCRMRMDTRPNFVVCGLWPNY